MSKNQVSGESILAQEVERDLESIAQEHPEHKGTNGEALFMRIPSNVLEGCAEDDVTSLLNNLSHMYDVPLEIKEKILYIRKISIKSKGSEVIERYFRKAEKEHLKKHNLSDLGFFVTYSPNVKWARQVSEELGIPFNEARARNIEDRRDEEVYGYVSDQIEEARRYHGDINHCHIKTQCARERYGKKVREIEGIISDLKERKIDTSRLEAEFNRLTKKQEKSLAVRRGYGKVVRNAIALALVGLLFYAAGFYVCNKQSEEKLTNYKHTIDELNQQYLDAWVNDSLNE